jgi:hypothetical protein
LKKVKTTIEIADDLLIRAQQIAKQNRTTLRALTEEGLRLILDKCQSTPKGDLPPLVTFGTGGPTESFADWNWDRIHNEVYKGRGT